MIRVIILIYFFNFLSTNTEYQLTRGIMISKKEFTYYYEIWSIYFAYPEWFLQNPSFFIDT